MKETSQHDSFSWSVKLQKKFWELVHPDSFLNAQKMFFLCVKNNKTSAFL